MTPHSDEPSRVIDTRGEEPFARTYVAVLLVEAVTLAALWTFSAYFSG